MYDSKYLCNNECALNIMHGDKHCMQMSIVFLTTLDCLEDYCLQY